MKQRHYSLSEIGKVIGKDKSVISREMKRNCDVCSGQYRSDLAQRKYQKRLKDKKQKDTFYRSCSISSRTLTKNAIQHLAC